MPRTPFLIVVVALCLFPSPGNAAEPWADPKLPVQDGLMLWLDASRASGDAAPSPDKPLAEWRDASGKQRHLSQPNSEAQPKWLKAGEVAAVRFDGVDDHFRAVKQGAELASFRLFIVAIPRQNLGGFRGLLAFNKAAEKDYTSGLTIDLGPFASQRFNYLNVEGRGFGGAGSLRKQESPFGQPQVLEISSDSAAKTIRLAIDGKDEGERARDGAPLSMEEITVGARYYNNGAGPQRVDGFGRTDIAEVLLYDRLLSDDEAKKVRDYLAAKYATLKEALPPDAESGSPPLVPVENPPPVQVFLPGFAVRELPLDLTNINNVKYREDGTLVALGYDGRIWLLKDTNSDGVEDKGELFWENNTGLRSPIGMDLTPPKYERGSGVFVVGKTRCVLIVDTDGDDKADKEIEVAGGWKESFHSVDGLGVAFDRRDGSVYYGRGTYNFTDPLLRDKDGKAQYSLSDESTSIIRVSPDFKTREVVATGIRFPVALRLNKAGDLFATDQEGATWVPNGNPFDELLHVQRGRHYGFPARHPKHLPNVIDEPSTFDYAPQHQSTCGLNFNEPVHDGGAIFGPKSWAGDAIVTGYSRGKLYRTQLVKSPSGYVARTQLFANLSMLTVDACVAPDGALVVACHSGGPDWGSGPTGKGKLYKITFSDQTPQPALVWASGPREVRIEFDRPVDPESLRAVREQAKLTNGNYARAGDRFETLWPGYAIVQMQKSAARRESPLRSAQLTPDRRTLVLATDPLAAVSHYALELPGLGRPAEKETPQGFLPQHAAVDLDFDLTGCEAVWTPADGGDVWRGWLPHVDLQVARAFTAGSAAHDALWKSLAAPGELVLTAQLDLTDMLRPAVQPGSQLDYEFPAEKVTLALSSSASASFKTGGKTLSLAPEKNKTTPVEIRLQKPVGDASLTIHWTTAEDERPRPLPLRRIMLPWADASGKASEPTPHVLPKELAGGSWAKGRKIYFSEQALCSKCHAIHGQGGDIGPDLSNLVHRDYASVLRDIATPSYAINPDHLTYNVTLADGRLLTGVVRTQDGKTLIGDAKGNVTAVAKGDIEEMAPSSISTMPDNLPKQLGEERMRDLLTFLLAPPPSMPRDYAGPRPPRRNVAEVHAALAGAPSPPEKTRPIKIVLVAGPKDHGPGEHDYPAWQKAWQELLSAADDVTVTTAWEWPTAEDFKTADTMIFYQHGDWNDARGKDIDPFLARGGGLVYIHWAVDGRKFGREFSDRIGLAALGGVGFRHGPVELKFNRDAEHPVIRNFTTLKLTDETYWKMVGTLPKQRTLAMALEEGADQPQLWSLEKGKGRVFVSIPGHYSWTFDDPLFRVLLLRSIAWSAHEPVDRFNDLVWPGAEFTK